MESATPGLLLYYFGPKWSVIPLATKIAKAILTVKGMSFTTGIGRSRRQLVHLRRIRVREFPHLSERDMVPNDSAADPGLTLCPFRFRGPQIQVCSWH